MTRSPGLVLFVFALSALSAGAVSGCKRHKPPPRVRIWLGPSHACSLQKTGELECWGKNDSGQLGDRTQTTRNLPSDFAHFSENPGGH